MSGRNCWVPKSSAAASGWNTNAAVEETSTGLGVGKQIPPHPRDPAHPPCLPIPGGINLCPHPCCGQIQRGKDTNPEFSPQENPAPSESQGFLLEDLGENRESPKNKQGKGAEGQRAHMDLAFPGAAAWILPGKIKPLWKIRRRMRNPQDSQEQSTKQEQGMPQTRPTSHPGGGWSHSQPAGRVWKHNQHSPKSPWSILAGIAPWKAWKRFLFVFPLSPPISRIFSCRFQSSGENRSFLESLNPIPLIQRQSISLICCLVSLSASMLSPRSRRKSKVSLWRGRKEFAQGTGACCSSREKSIQRDETALKQALYSQNMLRGDGNEGSGHSQDRGS